MTALFIIIVTIVLLFAGYVFYGAWLAKQWGINPQKKTPAVEEPDGVDYVAAKPIVLLGHHFSSIAGAGPINGPIQAAVFGWVPVFLWCVIGGIFVGGLQDFGSLFASVRNKGKSVGEIIQSSMGQTSKKLFIIFALMVLILVLASFINVVASTFLSTDGRVGFVLNPTGNQSTAMISLLFIVLAIGYGYLTNRRNWSTAAATALCLIGIVLAIIFGLNIGFAMSRTTWIVAIGIYITIASLAPVWILLQPRDYLSSFLLYGMMGLAIVGIVSNAFTGSAEFELPAFISWHTSIGPIFPALFITVACGACSGFHSLIATGTTSKQLDNEKNARIIGYGSMLVESALGVISLIAVGMVAKTFIADGAFHGAPPAAFASGIAKLFGLTGTNNPIYALLTLAVSVFVLTSLDTGTRLGRFMVSELFLKENEYSYRNATGVRKVLAFPLFGTLLMVIIGCILGGLSLSQIWSLFGTANQLLAGIALLAIAAWLGNEGKNNRMFFIPTVFMLTATMTQLIWIAVTKIRIFTGAAQASGPMWGHWFQFIFVTAMTILAIILVIESIKTFKKQKTA